MNSVNIIGRLTKDIKVSYTTDQTAVARVGIAISRGKDKNGNDRGADFPSCIAFGKTAEIIERYFHKGDLIGIVGRLQTGSYDKDGTKVYTTDVIIEKIDFIQGKAKADESDNPASDVPTGFSRITDEDIPF